MTSTHEWGSQTQDAQEKRCGGETLQTGNRTSKPELLLEGVHHQVWASHEVLEQPSNLPVPLLRGNIQGGGVIPQCGPRHRNRPHIERIRPEDNEQLDHLKETVLARDPERSGAVDIGDVHVGSRVPEEQLYHLHEPILTGDVQRGSLLILGLVHIYPRVTEEVLHHRHTVMGARTVEWRPPVCRVSPIHIKVWPLAERFHLLQTPLRAGIPQ